MLRTMHGKSALTIFTILAITLPFIIRTNNKNVCISYTDYLLVNLGGNCYFNPDVTSSVTEIIKKYAGKVQVYNVTTDDGYILSMFRLSHKQPKGVILLQPPISTGAIAFLSDGNHSLGFTLWRRGYDVWLSNHRGSPDSRTHANLTETDQKFWDFGFHEIAMNDLDPQFDVIRAETNNSKIIYMGYSMSTTEALIYAALKPERAEQIIQTFILVSPTASTKEMTGVFKYGLYAFQIFEKFGIEGEFVTGEMIRRILGPVTVVPYILNIMSSIIMGWTPDEIDPALLPYILAQHGRGMAYKMLYHYRQLHSSRNHFPMFDYGEERNRMVYNSSFAPDYPLEQIRNSLYVIYGEKDLVATPQDVLRLCDDLLPKNTVQEVIELPNHNHVDYLFSRHRRKRLYQAIYKILNQIENRNKIQQEIKF